MSPNPQINAPEVASHGLFSVDHQPLAVPLGVWLQLHCEDELGATWTEKQVYPEDVEYVHAGEIRRALMGHRRSELWGDMGLIATTMRCVDAIGKIEDLVTADHETKEAFIQRVCGILGHNAIGEARADTAATHPPATL